MTNAISTFIFKFLSFVMCYYRGKDHERGIFLDEGFQKNSSMNRFNCESRRGLREISRNRSVKESVP